MKVIFSQAVKILNDEMQCDIIKIGGLVRNKVLIVAVLYSYLFVCFLLQLIIVISLKLSVTWIFDE